MVTPPDSSSTPEPVPLRPMQGRRAQRGAIASPSLGTIPRPLTSFIGRDTEVATARTLLVESGCRLLTLTGPGGVGKTRLALRLAEEVAAAFSDGVVFVSLAALTDADLVLSTMIRELGLREGAPQAPTDLLADYLRELRLLLVLDNFEQVRPAATHLVALLATCPRLVALVTSRAPLHVAGEQRFPVLPLTVPDAIPDTPGRAVASSLATIAVAPAVQLFVARAQAVTPSFTLHDDNAAAVAAICRRLDGLPLAIELAAAWVRILSPHDLLARLERRLPLLRGGAEDQPARLRTMRAAIAWTSNFLTEDEARLFRQLAVFSGGFTLEAVEWFAAAASAPTTPDALDLLTGLLDKSLVQLVSPDAADSRFRLLETVREYALERLIASGEEKDARDAHAAYFLALSEAAREVLWSSMPGPAQTEWLTRLEDEHDNVRAALTWTLSHDAETALRLVGALSHFWALHGHLSEGLNWTERALALEDTVPDTVRARALYGASVLVSEQRRYERCLAFAEDALSLFRTAGDTDGAGRAIQMLAIAATETGQFDRAVMLFEELLAISRQLGHARGVAVALGQLGGVARKQGAYDRARSLLSEAVVLNREHDDPFALAWSLYECGELERVQGHVRAAIACLQESATLYMTLGSPGRIITGLLRLAALAEAAGQPEQAVRLFGAVDAQRASLSGPLLHDDPIDQMRILERARAHLGEARFAAVWNSGSALTLEEAIAEATTPIPEAAAAGPLHPDTGPGGLTVREREVLELLVRGWSDKEIATALAIGRRTVSNHVATIRDKLGAPSRAAAVAVAVRDHLV